MRSEWTMQEHALILRIHTWNLHLFGTICANKNMVTIQHTCNGDWSFLLFLNRFFQGERLCPESVDGAWGTKGSRESILSIFVDLTSLLYVDVLDVVNDESDLFSDNLILYWLWVGSMVLDLKNPLNAFFREVNEKALVYLNEREIWVWILLYLEKSVFYKFKNATVVDRT